jgi:polygalacturonase
VALGARAIGCGSQGGQYLNTVRLSLTYIAYKAIRMQDFRSTRVGRFCRWVAAALAALVLPAISALADPTLPTIPAGTFVVPAATGVATTDTNNIKNTIAAASAAGGGTVEVPAGTYLSNTFALASSINLHLDSGATIRNNAPTSAFITTSGTLHDIAITGSGIIDGRATNTVGNTLVSLRHITNVLVQGVTIQNSSKAHLVVQEDTNLTVDSININDNNTVSAHGGYLSNTDGIDFSGSHILIKNSNVSDGDDNIVAKPQSTFCSDITITNNVIGAGHGISVGGQTNAGLDGMTVSHITFNGTDNGVRMKSGAAAIQTSGGGGIVKNVSFSDITMTNVSFPIIINSWYNGGDHYGSQELSPSALHNLINPGDPTVNVDQTNNPDLQPFFDNVTYSNITATGATQNVAIIYGLNSIPASPTDPLRNIDNISFHNVNLSGSYGAAIFYASKLNLAGLAVTASNGNAINQFGNSFVLPGDYDGNGTVDGQDYNIWQSSFGSTTSLAADGNGNGTVDAGDYTVWRDHLGASAGSGAGARSSAAAVPEPSTLWLALLAAGLWSRFCGRAAAKSLEIRA